MRLVWWPQPVGRDQTNLTLIHPSKKGGVLKASPFLLGWIAVAAQLSILLYSDRHSKRCQQSILSMDGADLV